MEASVITKEAVLWVYAKLANGEHAIRVRITKDRDPKYITIGYSSSIKNWDSKNNCPSSTHPKYKTIIKKIEQIFDDIDFEVKLAERNSEYITSGHIKERVQKKSTKFTKTKVLSFFDIVIAELVEQDRIGTSNIFKSTKSTIEKLLDNKDKSFISFTDKDFKKYEDFISRLETENTKSFYLRTFYRLWNIAIDRKICPKEHHPKFYIKYKPYKRIKTKKRAIDFDYIKAIEGLHFEYTTRLFRSLNYFIFIYYSRGINFTDMARLKRKKNIEGDYLKYKRSKNGREYNFKLHPKAKAVVEMFAKYPLLSDAGYVFPILNSIHDSAKKIDVRIDSALKDLNEDLETFGNKVHAPKRITSYVIRHSFASNLKHKGVSINVIQEALGHETELQTHTYLEEMDDNIVAASIENALQ